MQWLLPAPGQAQLPGIFRQLPASVMIRNRRAGQARVEVRCRGRPVAQLRAEVQRHRRAAALTAAGYSPARSGRLISAPAATDSADNSKLLGFYLSGRIFIVEAQKQPGRFLTPSRARNQIGPSRGPFKRTMPLQQRHKVEGDLKNSIKRVYPAGLQTKISQPAKLVVSLEQPAAREWARLPCQNRQQSHLLRCPALIGCHCLRCCI